MQPMDEPLWTFEEISAATGATLPAGGVAGGEIPGARDVSAASFPRKRESISGAGTSSYMDPRVRGDDAAASISAAPGNAGGVSIDSRTLQPGDLFVAIKGEHADGHKFVEAAFERGASAAIVEASYEGLAPHPVPLPMGEGTPSQRAQRNSLSHGERAGVRGAIASY